MVINLEDVACRLRLLMAEQGNDEHVDLITFSDGDSISLDGDNLVLHTEGSDFAAPTENLKVLVKTHNELFTKLVNSCMFVEFNNTELWFRDMAAGNDIIHLGSHAIQSALFGMKVVTYVGFVQKDDFGIYMSTTDSKSGPPHKIIMTYGNAMRVLRNYLKRQCTVYDESAEGGPIIPIAEITEGRRLSVFIDRKKSEGNSSAIGRLVKDDRALNFIHSACDAIDPDLFDKLEGVLRVTLPADYE